MERASTLARELYEANCLGAFFDLIHQDPILSPVKRIAEPWDVGPGGYQVGKFPVLWSTWNGKYRDAVRRFWKGDGGTVSELAPCLSGRRDLYQSVWHCSCGILHGASHALSSVSPCAQLSALLEISPLVGAWHALS